MRCCRLVTGWFMCVCPKERTCLWGASNRAWPSRRRVHRSGGLSEGELVVSRGAFKLDSELQIKGRPSMTNAEAGLEERPAEKRPMI